MPVDHAQVHPQCSDDERKLADLHHAGAAPDSRVQVLTGQEDSKCGEEFLPHDSHNAQDQNRNDIFHQKGRLDQHAHGYEKDRAKQVLDGLDQMLDLLPFHRTCQNGSGQKSPQSRGESNIVGDDHIQQADGEGCHHQKLIVHEVLDFFEQGRDDVDSQEKPYDQVNDQDADLLHQGDAGYVLADRDRRQDHQHEDPGNIFDDQCSQHHLCEALILESVLFVCLHDDHGG